MQVTREISDFEATIKSARVQFNLMELYLRENSCSAIAAGPPKPTFACADNEAKDVATSLCVARELGPKLCEKISKDAVDIDIPKFVKDTLAREGCSAIVSEITGENYNLLDKTIKKYTADLSMTLFSELIGVFSKDVKDAFDWTVAASKARACIPSGIQLCKSKYATWQLQVNEHFEKFDQQIKSCNKALELRTSAKIDIENNEAHLVTAHDLLVQLNNNKKNLEQRADVIYVPHAIQGTNSPAY